MVKFSGQSAFLAVFYDSVPQTFLFSVSEMSSFGHKTRTWHPIGPIPKKLYVWVHYLQNEPAVRQFGWGWRFLWGGPKRKKTSTNSEKWKKWKRRDFPCKLEKADRADFDASDLRFFSTFHEKNLGPVGWRVREWEARYESGTGLWKACFNLRQNKIKHWACSLCQPVLLLLRHVLGLKNCFFIPFW